VCLQQGLKQPLRLIQLPAILRLLPLHAIPKPLLAILRLLPVLIKLLLLHAIPKLLLAILRLLLAILSLLPLHAIPKLLLAILKLLPLHAIPKPLLAILKLLPLHAIPKPLLAILSLLPLQGLLSHQVPVLLELQQRRQLVNQQQVELKTRLGEVKVQLSKGFSSELRKKPSSDARRLKLDQALTKQHQQLRHRHRILLLLGRQTLAFKMSL
jgi:hypothetical protein